MQRTRIMTELTCREVIAFLADYLDRSLPVAERRLLDEHLAACTKCSRIPSKLRPDDPASARHGER